jgi:cytochrome c oxidase cbb3-type subunit III
MTLETLPQNTFGLPEMLVVTALLMAIIVGLLGLEIYLELRRVKRQVAETRGLKPVRQTTWFDLFRRKGIQMDKFVEGHNYDGIQEYDNSPPAWFNWLFYVSVFAAFCYLMYFHVLKIGDLSKAEYEKQVKAAEPILARAQERAILLADQPRYTDQKNLEMGKMIFMSNCVICHGDKAQGNIGPNLTDDYWLHGGQYPQIFKTIFNGVPEKGMYVWKKSLKAEDIRRVASYVYTLKGTNPPNPKPPQGVKESGATSSIDTKKSVDSPL